MSRKLVTTVCRTFPGAEVSDPWGGAHDAWKASGKMLTCIGAVMPGVSVKTDSVETAQRFPRGALSIFRRKPSAR